MKRILIYSIVVILVGIQFIRPAQNIAAPGPTPNDLSVLHPPPAAVTALLARACNDCHTDTTRYPWYADIQPVAWWLNHHIVDGKRHLNFSQFGKYPAKRAKKKLEAIIDETREGGMPLTSYTLIHRDAKLTDADVKALADWVRSIQQSMAAK